MSLPIIVKAYASLYPAGKDALTAVQKILKSWHIEGAVELEGELLRISHEGVFFPDEDVIQALTPFLTPESRGKFDLIDMEAWMLHRWFFDGGHLVKRSASLNQALEACTRPGA